MCDLGRLGLQNQAADATIPADDWERLSEFTRFRGSRARSLASLERPADNREAARPNLAGPTSGRALHRGGGSLARVARVTNRVDHSRLGLWGGWARSMSYSTSLVACF